MKTGILISRLVRLVETGGGAGDGASLAQQYAGAVAALNARLEATQVALDSGQTSEAVRLMEDEPKLVDEVGALDFHQREPFLALCKSHGWPLPPAIDQHIVERILEVYNSSALLEPTLKAYRKAMRNRDERGIVRPLRRLVSLEPGNAEWARDLARAEASVQKSLAADFRDAADVTRREELAAALLDEPWTSPPAASAIAEAAAWRNRREAERRAREQAEDLSLLHQCADGIWSRAQAESLLAHLSLLAEQGTPVPPAEIPFTDSLRTRCAAEAKAEADAERWSELMASLHAAVEHASPDEIRLVMAAPEFLDRPPDEDLLRAARRVVRDAEEQRRRKTRLVVALGLLVLAAIATATAKLYADRMFRADCAAQVAELERLARGPLAHETLAKALANLKSEKPKVYADAAVSAYEQRLVSLREERSARLALAADAVERLEAERTGGWEGDTALLDDLFAKAEDNLRRGEGDDDVALANRLDAVRLDFERIKGVRRETQLALAAEEAGPLVDEARALAETLGREFLDDHLRRRLADFRGKADLWKSHHAGAAAEQAARLDEAFASLDAPEKRSGEAAQALARLHAATNAAALLAAREALCTHYGAFRGVQDLSPLPYSAADAGALLSGGLDSQKRFARNRSRPMDKAAFAKFLEENVLWLDEEKSFVSLYGLGKARAFEAFAIGKADMTMSGGSRNTVAEFRGDILVVRNSAFARTDECELAKTGEDQGRQTLLPPCIELRDVLDKAKSPGVTESSFASFLWGVVEAHLAASHDDLFRETVADDVTDKYVSRPVSYEEFESRKGNPLGHNRFPAWKRVQTLSLYFGWLEALGALPNLPGAGFAPKWDRFRELASPVRVDGVPDSLAWLCLTDPRVQKRNAECAKFLAGLPASFAADCRAAVSDETRLGAFARWRAEYAGQMRFIPARTAEHFPSTLPGTAPDHPLYVLRRRDDGSLFLRRFVVPQPDRKTGKPRWAFLARDASDYIPAEPLFQLRDGNGAFVDPAVDGPALLATLSPAVKAVFRATPFWIEF